MFVTNLTNTKLGVNGIINLRPREVNRYIDDTDADLVDRICRLEAANMVSVVRSKGLEKNGLTPKVNGRAVKTVMGADKGALSNGPRTEGVEVVTETVKKPKSKKAKTAETAESAETTTETTTETTAETSTETKTETTSYRRSRKAKTVETADSTEVASDTSIEG